MPPRTKQHTVKFAARTTCTTSKTPTIGSILVTYPWPREEGEPIKIDDPRILYFNVEGWDKTKARHYNALLGINILPSHFVHSETLSQLGLDEDVHATLNSHGIGDLCYRTHILYPDLVRQALALAEISYEDPDLSTFENASFSFLANGKYCSLSLEKLTEIYELAEERKDIAFPRNFNPTQAFWDLMATGEFKSHSAS
ncbi:hypothetical protein F2Q70_00026199 [Brassica cretica]|uniref:Arabidopsis retrotransposon Orf1 C-terminal domain-containing protein n=1 Tax=Brassica cretica TaxID=69181 RepID=A0A8S9LK04_BRACR|nr:hypothetical protein F2Q70_00026199 [Brassica cretica]